MIEFGRKILNECHSTLDLARCTLSLKEFLMSADIEFGTLIRHTGRIEARQVDEILCNKPFKNANFETLMRFVDACGGRINMQWENKDMAVQQLKFERDIQTNLRAIARKAKRIFTDSGMTAEAVAETMNLGSVAPVEQIMSTGSVNSMHMQTLVRFVRACGYEVKISFEKLEMEEPKEKEPARRGPPEVRVKEKKTRKLPEGVKKRKGRK